MDAILVVQSEVYQGPGASQQVMDLETVLPHAFPRWIGVPKPDVSGRLQRMLWEAVLCGWATPFFCLRVLIRP